MSAPASTFRTTVLGFLIVGSLLGHGLDSPLSAQASPNGPQLQVNTYTTGSQGSPAVAIDGAGAALVVWQSMGSFETDNSGYSVQARLFDALGRPLGVEFQVNAYTTGTQWSPAVAGFDGGGFVVAWQSPSDGDPDFGIRGRRYDAAGTPLGPEFQVNSETADPQWNPRVATDGQGGFVVTWFNWVGWPDNDIRARRFDASGVPVGPDIVGSRLGAGSGVAADAQGNFVVVWQDYTNDALSGQRFDADGVALGSELTISADANAWQAAIAGARSGEFVVAWNLNLCYFGCYSAVNARRFGADGTPLGPEFEVAGGDTATYRWHPAVAKSPGHGFVVSWDEGTISHPPERGDAPDAAPVKARRYRDDGSPLGTEFQVNSYTPYVQWVSQLAMDGDGNFVVVWESSGSAGSDQSLSSVQVQRFDELFRDGLESRDTNRWSAAVP